MHKLLQQNKKMAKASVVTYQFSLPSVSTCPGAGTCKQFCFAALEELRYPSARNYRARMLELTKDAPSFIAAMAAEVTACIRRAKGKQVAIRIHASGDFYSPAYLQAWHCIATLCPSVQFYAYTKSVAIAQRLAHQRPANLTLIYSLGGTMDSRIDLATERHSRIFATEADALAAGYALANVDDSVAWASSNTRIGLVMFGARKRKGNAALGNVAGAA